MASKEDLVVIIRVLFFKDTQKTSIILLIVNIAILQDVRKRNEVNKKTNLYYCAILKTSPHKKVTGKGMMKTWEE